MIGEVRYLLGKGVYVARLPHSPMQERKKMNFFEAGWFVVALAFYYGASVATLSLP